jgi:hypothetical protein
MDIKAALTLMSAALSEQVAKFNIQTASRGYYHRFTGKSKTFKKNKRRGL